MCYEVALALGQSTSSLALLNMREDPIPQGVAVIVRDALYDGKAALFTGARQLVKVAVHQLQLEPVVAIGHTIRLF